MGIAKEIGLDPQQIDDIIRTEWNIRVATIGPGERINLTPMWFGWAGGKIYIHGRGQKIINLAQESHLHDVELTATKSSPNSRAL